MSNTEKYLNLAEEASKKIGWLPEVIFTQWQVETAHFTSNNFKKNNNIAGQTWYSGLSEISKGSARPKSEGGFYIKYNDPIQGYVDFILNNHRYDKVKQFSTAEGQFKEIARTGWAAAPNYADVLISVYRSNLKNGVFRKIVSYTGIVKFGDKGEQVKKIQEKLGILADGDFGSITVRTVKEFQQKNKLMVDGVVGKQTWTKLFTS